MQRILVVIPIVALTILASNQLANSRFDSGMAGYPRTKVITGLIEKADESAITISTGNGTRQISVKDDVTVTRNNVGLSVGTLHNGDFVTIVQAPNAEVISVAAVTAATVDFNNRAFTALPGLVLLGLLPYFYRKTAKPKQIMRTSYVS